jgi:general secretion pathway protein J
MPQSGARAREGGFTLIELLVSLTILGVILGLLGAGLRVLSKNWEANAQRIDALDMISRAVDILHRDAAGLQRVVVVAESTPKFLFTGGADHLAFVTLEPPYPTAAGPYFVSYSVAANGPTLELIRARAQYQKGLLAFPGATPANRVRLVQGPFRYRFSYAKKASKETVWRDAWTDQSRLPDLIRLQIIDSRQNAAVSRPVIVAVPADAELGCLAEKPKVCSAKSGGALKAQAKQAKGQSASRYQK